MGKVKTSIEGLLLAAEQVIKADRHQVLTTQHIDFLEAQCNAMRGLVSFASDEPPSMETAIRLLKEQHDQDH